MNKADLKARILATANPKPSPIEVDGWGTVYVKPLTVGDIESFNDDTDPKLKAARSIARVLCDEGGELLFDPQSPEDLFAINRLPLSAISVINGAVEKLNATTEAEAIDLGNVSPPATDSSSI
ncbi:hypothetical protein [Variovorax sp. PAMC 28711]|uniref:hypothetical protein n=1 Tax=Variovorax sp. PAMC 28711 TaxID=1795631 RepID=UPI00078DC863|nr:hypothetical protein [Variovorax sp. PAMC 28711]AMM23164.1 hypothetical protein AX767_01335 [Variovorax sp. PAMC 28711]